MQVAMKYSTPGYQDIGKVLRGSLLSDSSQIFSCNESHFKHQNLKMRGQLSMLGSKSLNLKMRGHPSFLGFKSSPVSLNQNLERRVLGSKSLSGSLVRKPKLVCKCFGSQDQRLARTLTTKYEVLPSLIIHVTLVGVFSTLVFLAFIARRYQIEFLPRVLKMNPAIAPEVTVLTFLIFVICGAMDIMKLKPDQIVFTAGLASVLFSLIGKKIFESASCALLLYKQLNVGDFIRVKYDDSEVTGIVESMGLMSLLICDLSGEVHSIPNDKFAGLVYVKMSVGAFKIVSFRFVVSQDMTHKIDDVITKIDEIGRKFSCHKNEKRPNFACVETLDDNLKDVRIVVSCLVQVNDVEEYIRIKGAIMLEVSKLLSEVATSR